MYNKVNYQSKTSSNNGQEYRREKGALILAKDGRVWLGDEWMDSKADDDSDDEAMRVLLFKKVSYGCTC